MDNIKMNPSFIPSGDFGSMAPKSLESSHLEDAPASSAVDNPSADTANTTATEQITNTMGRLTHSVDDLTGVTTGLGNTLTNPDGSVVDISDKVGRQEDRQVLENIQTQINAILGRVPSSLKAEVCEEDRSRLDKVLLYFKHERWLLIFLFVVAGFLFGTLCMGLNDARFRSNELETWYHDQRDAICFGHYLREHNPKLYEYWYSGRWQRKVASKDSIAKAHMYELWDKKVLDD